MYVTAYRWQLVRLFATETANTFPQQCWLDASIYAQSGLIFSMIFMCKLLRESSQSDDYFVWYNVYPAMTVNQLQKVLLKWWFCCWYQQMTIESIHQTQAVLTTKPTISNSEFRVFRTCLTVHSSYRHQSPWLKAATEGTGRFSGGRCGMLQKFSFQKIYKKNHNRERWSEKFTEIILVTPLCHLTAKIILDRPVPEGTDTTGPWSPGSSCNFSRKFWCKRHVSAVNWST